MIDLLQVLKGNQVEDEGIIYRNYKLDELIDMGINKWQKTLSLTLLDKESLFEDSPLTAEELDRVHIFDAMCFSPVLNDWAKELFNTFLVGDWDFDGNVLEFACYSLGKVLVINKSNIDNVFANIRTLYCIHKAKTDYDISKATSQNVVDMLKEFEEIKKKQNKDDSGVTYESIIESVTVKHFSYNLFNVWELTLYQLMHTYYRMEHVDNYNNVLRGVYSGAVSGKDLKINEIHWAKKIAI